MPRIPDVLERESRTVDLEPGDFERLLGRRERKQRNRRIRAGPVGVLVALATGDLPRPLADVGPDPGEPPVSPAGAGGGRHPRVRARRRRLRGRSGRVERGQDRERPRRQATAPSPRRVVLLGRGVDVVARRAVPRLSLPRSAPAPSSSR